MRTPTKLASCFLLLLPVAGQPEPSLAGARLGPGPFASVRALFVGINDFDACVPYSGKSPPQQPCEDLRFPEADVRRLQTALGNAAEPRARLKSATLLGGDASASATRAAIHETLHGQGAADSLVILYLSTHGLPDGRLLAANANPETGAGMLPLSEIVHEINSSPAAATLLLVDACYAGGALSSAIAGLPDLDRQLLLSQSQLLRGLILGAARANERALEDPGYCEGGGGALACGLVQALEGDADLPHDGYLNLEALRVVVGWHVARATAGAQNTVGLDYFAAAPRGAWMFRASRRSRILPDALRPQGDFAAWFEGAYPMLSVPGGAIPVERPDPLGRSYLGQEVRVDPFELGRDEVTRELYERVLRVDPAYHRDEAQAPVESVSWFDAVRFANRLSELLGADPCYENDDADPRRALLRPGCTGFRLPTDAEWRRAALQAPRSPPPWSIANSSGRPRSVPSPAPAEGPLNLPGNVWEWVHDGFAPESPEEPFSLNPKGNEDAPLRLARGGSYFEDPAGTTANAVVALDPGKADRTLGFRLARGARTPEGPPPASAPSTPGTEGRP